MATRTPSPRVRRAWKIVGTLVAVPVLLFGGFQVAGALAHEERTEVSELDAAGLRRIEIDNDDGSVRLVGIEDADAVTVTARISDGWRATGHDVRREGHSAVVEGTCPIVVSEMWCSVDYTIELPSDLAVMVRSDNGGVTVTDMAADVEASSDNGRIELARIQGDVLLESDNGLVTASDLRAARAEATTDNGSVSLTFVDPPDDVVATTDNGSIDIVVPDTDDFYRVEADTDNGTRSTGGIGTSPDADRTITATSDHGDVTITYALD